jgi:AcrR family transcriptional regulator
MGLRAQRREQQTIRILEAAKLCFVRSGFRGASMHEICTEAEMSPGALYRYFPSKEAIIEAIAEADRREDAEILSTMLANPSIIDGFVDATIAHIRHVHESGFSGLFSEVRAEGMRNERLRASCEASMNQARDAFREYLEKGMEKGEIEPVVPIDAFLDTMMAIGEGLILNDLPARGVSYEMIATLMRNSLLANLRPRENATETPKPAAPTEDGPAEAGI